MQDPANLSPDQVVLIELVLSLPTNEQQQIRQLAQQLFMGFAPETTTLLH